MSSMSKLDEYKTRYLTASHAMQSGVAYDKDASDQTPKHLRVGVNSSMVQNGALLKLLMEKGIITEEEWWKALSEAMEHEWHEYERRLSIQFNREVVLA